MRALVILVSLAAVGCDRQEQRGAPTASATASTTAAVAPPASDDKIEPVYPREDEPHDPLAVSFCEALHEVPAKRRAECCNTGAGGAKALVQECARTLSYALRAGSVTLDRAKVGACIEARTAELAGCDWVGPSAPPTSAACETVIEGTVRDGALCRSSLECAAGLRCHGLGAVRPGKCGKPLVAGAPCGPGPDTLAALTQQNTYHDAHPLCEGVCTKDGCKEPAAVGGACTKSDECGRGRVCRGGKCAEGPLPGPGEKCAGVECARGARCVDGTCSAAKLAGEICTRDMECRGACEKPAGAAEGKCAMRCAGPSTLPPPIVSATASARPSPR
jgi:hypothetical protein